MSVGLLLGLAVLFLGYAFLYVMVRRWGGGGVSFHDAVLGTCE